MEIEYLKNRRLYQRIDDTNVIVYYRLIGPDVERDSNGKNALKEKIFGENMLTLYNILRNRGAKYETVIDIINTKVNKLINLINSFANPEMKIAELSTVNLSASGIRFCTKKAFQQGDRVELLMIFLPTADLIDCRCEIVRVLDVRDDRGEYSDVAVKYVILDEDDKHKIVNYVKVIIENLPFS